MTRHTTELENAMAKRKREAIVRAKRLVASHYVEQSKLARAIKMLQIIADNSDDPYIQQACKEVQDVLTES